MAGIGAGLAARKRQDENAALARRLVGIAPLDLQALLEPLCSARPVLAKTSFEPARCKPPSRPQCR
ncbi:MAG TPA: hypothetical protein VK509_12805 [Polyangiales bacterium]|nr:hypothetical protein [Polyangiales bacterium]